MITLGIDVGTTHTKVLALDVATGRTLALEVAPTPSLRDAQGDAHRPADVLATVVTLMGRVVRRVEHPAAVRALCAASVGEEVVLLDGDRRPIGDAIAWFDPRGTEEAAAFERGPGAGLPLSRRFPPDPSFSLFKLLWLRDHRPGELAAARSWIDLGGWVLSGLGAEPAMDWSHASRAGAFDLVARAWDEETIDAAGLGGLAFPALVPSGSVIGTVSPEIATSVGLPSGVAIVAGGHDHLCAAYAAGLRDTHELFLSAGTSEAHLALTTAPLELAPGPYGVDQGCYVDGDLTYVHVNIHSGHVFRQWRGLLYGDTPEERMYAEVERVPRGARGVSFDLLDDLRQARLDRVPYTADRAAIMCAVLEGLARRSGEIVDSLEEAVGHRFEHIVATGHPTLVPYWRQLRLETYGRAMTTVDEPESAALGAAMLAARAHGASSAGEAAVRRVTWHPDR
jgi:sugar (pentulose or hexulose) kinase